MAASQSYSSKTTCKIRKADLWAISENRHSGTIVAAENQSTTWALEVLCLVPYLTDKSISGKWTNKNLPSFFQL